MTSGQGGHQDREVTKISTTGWPSYFDFSDNAQNASKKPRPHANHVGCDKDELSKIYQVTVVVHKLTAVQHSLCTLTALRH